MIRTILIAVALGWICMGCGTSGGVKDAGSSVGSVLRAPVDFVSGLGTGLSGSKLSPNRSFEQNWEDGIDDPVFWEDDSEFFSSL
ncbi:hypothetical protein GF373_07960 [bacterium]|nr:hypothetical protein [bacterium]